MVVWSNNSIDFSDVCEPGLVGFYTFMSELFFPLFNRTKKVCLRLALNILVTGFYPRCMMKMHFERLK